MRNSYKFLLITIFTTFALRAQVKIGDNPQNIDPSSVLELESTDKVLVITRVTTAQMNAIVPSQGALCFNTDLQSVHYYDGTQWVNIGGSTGTGGPLTADPIVNTQPTIVITPTATGDNLEVAPNSIRSEQIVDGGVNGVDIQDGSIGPGKLQDFSITQEKLSENSVGAFALDNDSFGVSAFNNDIGYLTAADINLVSTDVGNVLENRVDGVFYNDQPLITAINQNTDAIALDDDQSAANEIQNLTLNGSEIGLTDTAGTIDIGPLINAGNTDNQNLGTATLDGANMLTINIEDGNPTTVDLSPLASGATADGSETIINPTATITVAGTGTALDPYELTAIGGAGGTTEVVDGTTLTGTGTGIDPFKIEPGATGQVLTTNAAGVVWANPAPGGGSTEEADQTTITGVGTNADPFKIEPGADGQVLVTSGTAVTWATPAAAGSTEEADQITITGIGTNADPFKIEPSITPGQFLRTDAAGDVIWDDLPTGTGGAVTSDGVTIVGTGADAASALSVPTGGITDVQIANGTILAEDLNNMGATDGQILKWDDATTSWVLAADDTGVAALTDGNIFVGDAANTPQDVTLQGDATIDNTGMLTIEDDAITLAKIDQNSATDGQIMKWDDATTSWILADDDTGAAALNDGDIFVGDATNTPQGVTLSGDATIDNTGVLTIADDAITLAKIDQNGATDGQVMKWDDATTSWILADDDTGTAALTDGNIFVGDAANTPQDVALQGDATIDNTGVLTIENDAITSAKIENATILAEDLNAMGATDGQVLIWDEDAISPTQGEWVPSTNTAHTGTANEIFFADTGIGEPTSSDGFVWNPTAITGGFEALGIGLDGRTQSTRAKVHIDEQRNALGELSYGLQLQNRGGVGNGVGVIFAVDAASTNGKGALLYERTGVSGIGDFHFLQSTGGTDNPIITDKAFTITNDKHIGLYGGIDIGGAGTGFGTAGQMLASGGPGNPVQWVNPGAGGTVNTDATIDGDGSVATPLTIADDAITTVKILDENVTPAKIEAGTNGQVLTTDATGDVIWLTPTGGGDNLSTANLTQTAGQDRTYDLNGQNLVFTGLGNVGIGSSANPPENKFHVAGEIRSEGFNSTFGSAGAPAYSFATSGNPDSDTGMYRAGADQIGFSVGGFEALRIEEPSTGNTNVIVNQSLELNGMLLDKDGDAGTAGQVLSSTGGANPQTDWVDATAGSSPIKAFGKISGLGVNLKTNGASVVQNMTGDYTVTLNTARSDANYVIQLSTTSNAQIFVIVQTPADFTVQITDVSGTLINSDWYFTVID